VGVINLDHFNLDVDPDKVSYYCQSETSSNIVWLGIYIPDRGQLEECWIELTEVEV